MFQELISYFVPKVMGYLFGYDQTLEEERRLESLKSVVPVTKNWMLRSLLSLFESLLMKNETRDSLSKKEQEQKDKEEAKRHYEEMQGLNRTDTKKKVKEEKKLAPELKSEAFSLFLMSVTWSFGAALHTGGRALFSEFLQGEVAKILKEPQLVSFGEELQMKQLLDSDGDYFSCFYDSRREEWLRWDCEIDKFVIGGKDKPTDEDADENGLAIVEEEVEFQSILVPTEDTVRYSFILNALAYHSFPVLFIGDTGTGKTSAIKKF